MIGRARVIGLTLLALAVPTFAFGGEQAPPGPAALSVSASLGGCGLASSQVTCQIDASWNAMEGADYYTVSVARPDGVVLDLGQSPGTSRSIFVPYVGPGSYSVQVAAWGTPPGEDEPELLDRDRSFSAEGGNAGIHTAGTREDRSGGEGGDRDAESEAPGDPAEQEPLAEPPANAPPGCPEAGQAGESRTETAAGQADPAVSLQTEQYDPADADGNDGCTLESSP